MNIASVAHVKARFSAYLKEAEEGPVIVTRNGKPVAVLVAVNNQDDLERLVLAHSPRLQRLLESARESIEAGAGIPHARFWKDMQSETQHKKRTRKPRKTIENDA